MYLFVFIFAILIGLITLSIAAKKPSIWKTISLWLVGTTLLFILIIDATKTSIRSGVFFSPILLGLIVLFIASKGRWWIASATALLTAVIVGWIAYTFNS